MDGRDFDALADFERAVIRGSAFLFPLSAGAEFYIFIAIFYFYFLLFLLKMYFFDLITSK